MTTTQDCTVDLVIRFTSHADVPLTISNPSTTSVLTLKRILRRTVDHLSESRLTLIHAGRLLNDGAAVSTLLPRPPAINQPLLRQDHDKHDAADSSARDLGRDDRQKYPAKADPSEVVDVDTSQDTARVTDKGKGKALPPDSTSSIPRIYIHCAVSDPLSATDLASESARAEAYDHALGTPQTSSSSSSSAPRDPGTHHNIAPPPRPLVHRQIGFSRLLETGFTESDVAQLREQFRAVIRRARREEDMPSPDEMAGLEDDWLDNNYASATGSTSFFPQGAGMGAGFANAAGDGTGGPSGQQSETEALMEWVLGNVVGFFWPLGAMGWVGRGEVWTYRQGMAVVCGVFVNVCFGLVRMLG